MARRPNLALHLPLYRVRDKIGLHIFKWLGKKSRVLFDVWELYGIHP